MSWLYKILKQNPDDRDGAIVVTSVLGIFINLVIAGVKVLIGVLASSVAILSEGANNAADALTSILTLVGTKLAGKHPTKEHPFGFGRIEYLTSLIISALIIFTGFEFLTSSVTNIFHPAALEVSYLSLIIVAVSAFIKLFLGLFTINTGKRVDSGSLIAVGTECRNDSVASLITIISALLFLIFGLNVDGFAGLLTSLLILKAGLEIVSDTVSDLLGKAGDDELARNIYSIVRKCPIVLAAADMMLHNYGPDNYSGSCNIEIDHNKTVDEVYAYIHEMQLKIMHEYNVTMVFGIYAVDYDSPDSVEMRKQIAAFVREHEHISSYHALYKNENEKRIYVDLIVDYDLLNWDDLKSEFTAYMNNLYPAYSLELTIETLFV